MSVFFKQNRETGQWLITADLQNRHLFRLVIIEDFTKAQSLASAGLAVLNQAADIAISYMIRSITLPPQIEIEYDDDVGLSFPKTYTRGEEVSIEFLENEDGMVWRYLQTWRKQIVRARPDEPVAELRQAVGQGQGIRTDYVFADNQLGSKRLGVVLLGSGFNNKRQKFPRIMLHGLQIKSTGEISLDNYDPGNLILTATMKVEEVGAPFI